VEIPGTVNRWRFYRNLFLDSYSSADSHAQGIYLDGVGKFTLEENIFDLCGWHPDVPQADPTMFNHCIYWQKKGPMDGVVKRNIIMRGSSHGVQMRSSGYVIENVFARNAINGFLANDVAAGVKSVYGEAIGNVFTESEDITPRQGHSGGSSPLPRGWGFELIKMDGGPTTSYVFKNNILSKCTATGACETFPASLSGSEIAGNIVWKWKASRRDNAKESAGPFVDPDRTLATYNASLGKQGTFDAFVAEVRKQSKANWRPEYGAQAIVKYFQDGFKMP
jgi:hypothetical protein